MGQAGKTKGLRVNEDGRSMELEVGRGCFKKVGDEIGNLEIEALLARG